MYINSPDISPEATIVVRAQQIYSRWQKSGGTMTFEHALTQELNTPLDPFMGIARHCLAVRRVAEAIHAGQGTGFSDRAKLLEIAHDAITQA
jgi:hypothetical protein